MEQTTIAIIGPGRVGGSLARALDASGATVTLAGRDTPVPDADVVIVAVPDAELDAVVGSLIRALPDRTTLAHTCGSAGLTPFAGRGRVGVFHPATPIPTGATPLRDVYVAIGGDDPGRRVLRALADRIGARSFEVADDAWVRYHAALVHASNHLVALAADAAALLGDAQPTLVPLLEATVANIARLGPGDALTGPISRGDVATIRQHLAALPDPIGASYRANGRRALALAVSTGRLDGAAAAAVRAALDEDLDADVR